MADRYMVITAVGPDRPGLIAEISSVISEFGCNIEDMDQVVMKGIFILSMLIKLAAALDLNAFRNKLEYICHELGLEVSFYYAGGR
ncbi:MAG: ACT domain-containing protein [Candidatus Methanomethyliaceae archaeon]|nr:ACT domain-containing protein [Candidatus Verstraetearchaeota archaeon]